MQSGTQGGVGHSLAALAAEPPKGQNIFSDDEFAGTAHQLSPPPKVN
jgi:hypothetical protein